MILKRIFGRKPAHIRATAAVPPGERVYAIGDIHGRDDLFAALIDQIVADDRTRGAARTTLILLGDLVDRGPASCAVVERAIKLQQGAWHQGAWRLRWLIGNHEEVFLKALRGDPKVMRYFVRIGGAPTIHSYGLDGDAYAAADFDQLAVALPTLVPAEHAQFLDAGEDQIIIGDYLFVHAGVRPGVVIGAQSVGDLRWIRDDFLDDRSDHGKVVVHGHTITDTPEDFGNRIGIDTGAYASGVLTAIGIEGEDRWYLATKI